MTKDSAKDSPKNSPKNSPKGSSKDSPKKEFFKPGEKASGSGQVEIVGPRGGKTNEGERTIVKGKTLPPTPKPGQKYKPVDPTDNKSGF